MKEELFIQKKHISKGDILHNVGNMMKGVEGFLDILPLILKEHNVNMDLAAIDGELETINDLLGSAEKRVVDIYKYIHEL